MVVGIIHRGSGLGDQLFSYVATRVRAADLGVDFGFVGEENFKGVSFMGLDWGEQVDYRYHIEYPTGKLVIDNTHKLFVVDKPHFDPEFDFIEDGTVIDGYGAQDERYFEHRLPEIREWLKVEELFMPNDLCVINFRGGEFAVIPDLFLPKGYWGKGIEMMRAQYPGIKFEVHTDDLNLAEQFFPEFECIASIGLNWQAVRYAKHLVISNSAFAIIPALLGGAKEIIAPHYWARRNTGQWSMPSNYYKRFTYI